MKNKFKLGILISGSGTNLQAIIDSCTEGRITAQVAVVISNSADAYGLKRAEKAVIPAIFINPYSFESDSLYNQEILQKLQTYEVDLVVMAGYMKLLGADVLRAFPHAVLNLHPALLPSFPGAHGIKDAFDYGVKVTGVTVHFANEEFDKGEIIMQKSVIIDEGDDLDSLEAKIHQAEYEIYPQAIELFIKGRLEIVGRKVKIKD